MRAETCGLVVVVAVLSAAAWPALADAPEAEKASDDEPQLITGTLLEETPQERKDKYWYLILGVANVWPRLDESESEINRDINGLFGNVFPRWHNPTTFKDWRDDLMLWDIHIGLGRSLSDHWSLFTTVGAIRGTARTKNDYWTLGFPLEVYTKFERKVWFIAAGADYYPWGKASLEDATKGRNALTRRLYAARPYLEAGGGYVNLYAVGQTKMALPFLGDIAKVKHAEYYDLFYLSPRVGVDIPLNDTDHVGLMFGYLFFLQHPDEYNAKSYYIMYKHRF